MPRTTKTILTLCAVAALLAAACKRHPPKLPEPEPDTMASADVPPPPPPPKPKCKTLDEKCVAKADTRVKIGTQGLSFQPPEGWLYASEKTGPAISLTEENDAALGFVLGEGADPDKVVEALSPLMEKLEITDATADAIKKKMKKPAVEMESEGLKLRTWEITHKVAKLAPKMKGEPGMLLVVVSPLESQALVGVVFIQQKVLDQRREVAGKALQTLRGAQ